MDEVPAAEIRFGTRRHEETPPAAAKREAVSCSELEMLAVPPGKRLLTVWCDWHRGAVVAVLTTGELLTRQKRAPFPHHSTSVSAPCGECVAAGVPLVWAIDMGLLRQAYDRVQAASRLQQPRGALSELRNVGALGLMPSSTREVYGL